MPHIKLPQNKFLKIGIIIFAIPIALYFLPFIIGGYLSYFVYKSIQHKIIRFSIIAGILFPTFFLGTTWAAGLTESTSHSQSASQVSPTPTTTILTTIPTSLPTPANQPTDKPIPSPTPQKDLYSVARIVDGDTIDVNIDGKIERIRLIGIDTPEILDPRKPVQCFGSEASAKAKEILTGKKVSLESDPAQGERDKYDRLLRYIFLEDGVHFNKMMIAEGFAHEYTYAIPYKYQEELKQAEKDAREQEKGLWNPSACTNFIPITNTPYIYPTKPPVVPKNSTNTQGSSGNNNSTAGGFTCNCGRTCTEISSCAEAQFQLNSCGCKQRDADKDGIACDSAPLHCQN